MNTASAASYIIAKERIPLSLRACLGGNQLYLRDIRAKKLIKLHQWVNKSKWRSRWKAQDHDWSDYPDIVSCCRCRYQYEFLLIGRESERPKNAKRRWLTKDHIEQVHEAALESKMFQRNLKGPSPSPTYPAPLMPPPPFLDASTDEQTDQRTDWPF